MNPHRRKYGCELFGVGVDIFKIQRVKDMIKRKKRNVLEKIFTQNEIQRAKQSGRYAEQLASFFAGKEAVFKALNFSWADGIKWTDMEIINDERGPPSVNLMGKAYEVAVRREIREIFLSLSYETDYAICVCIVMRELN